MRLDPLVLDVLQDCRTCPLGNGIFERQGVRYHFAADELQNAMDYMIRRLHFTLDIDEGGPYGGTGDSQAKRR